MSNENPFLEATRTSLRFETTSGHLSTEDLWQLSLQSLDALAVKIADRLREPTDTFLRKPKKTATGKQDELRLEVLKAVIEYRQDEEERRKAESERRRQIQFLRNLRTQKELEKISSQTIDEIDKQLKELEGDESGS